MDKMGLVLAGGGALGAYEVGVYEVLKQLGYKFDIITGTSIGAINASFIASGQFEKALELWETASTEMIMKDGINISLRVFKEYKSDYQKLIKAGKSFIKNKFSMDNTPFKEYVKANLDIDRLYDSPVELGVVTTRIPSFTGEEVVVKQLPRDKVLSYIHASSACVPVFPIETIDDKKYIDGVYHDNLPIQFAFNLGATKVIAVDLRLFSMKPQNSFFLSLPNVTYIAPYINLGAMMDFSHDTISKNIELGRLDALKHFKILRGYYYAFRNEECPFANEFITGIVEKYGKKSKLIFKQLTKGIRTPMDEIDYYYRTLEIILRKCGFNDYYRVISINEAKQIISSSIKNRQYKKNIYKLTHILAHPALSSYFNDFLSISMKN
ncbi:MAG: patatin-like phospholipase family protein [Bacilli bacterium]|nr:patatin-like phospholipase family protein [Bacilli bacterium]